MMNWLNNSRRRTLAPALEPSAADPDACYASFKEHWQQAYKIIERSHAAPSHDDVLGVVNHLEQLVTLLLFELRGRSTSASAPCLEYLLVENLLDKVYEWGLRTGRYRNAVRLEQIKLYEVLVNSHELLMHEPFLRPLLKLLLSCQGECFPEDVVRELVQLLYQLCVALVQRVELLDLFFVGTGVDSTKFIIFALLIPHVHTEGGIGLQARDALLLCMSLSKKNENIAQNSNVCPMLAIGLSGLYSVLPRALPVPTEDWHRLTPDDVKEIKELAVFLNSLEFCNAAAQVAHPSIKRQLLDFLYQGFLVPVLKPALLQPEEAEQAAALAYLELIVRSVSEPGLLPALITFLLRETFNDAALLEILMTRIVDGPPRVVLVSLALFETLLELNCEDLMLELVFKHLRPCAHVMLSQRHLALDADMYTLNTLERLFALAPACCRLAEPLAPPPSQQNGTSTPAESLPTNWNHYSSQLHDSLLGNYHAYLCDARQKIAACRQACTTWSASYDCDEDSACSLQSLADSSGYESLQSQAVWKRSATATAVVQPTVTQPPQANLCSSVGLFLDVLLEKLSLMLTNSVYVNLHLTGLISRLAVYPHTLLQSYLLNSQLVLQPNVRSIFQVVGVLKQQIDEYMRNNTDADIILSQARTWLLERETKMLNARRKGAEHQLQPLSPINMELTPSSYLTTKNSLTNSISSMLRRTSLGSNLLRGKLQAQHATPTSKETHESILMTSSDRSSSHMDNVALCAILLDEWLKELAAVSQEQTIARLSDIFSRKFLH